MIVALTPVLFGPGLAGADAPRVKWEPEQPVLEAEQPGRILGVLQAPAAGPSIQGVTLELLKPSSRAERLLPEPWVRSASQGRASVLAHLTTGAKGSFQVDGLAPGRYLLRCAEQAWGSCSAELFISLEQPVHRLELEIRPRREVSGRVLNEQGQPLSQIFVYVAGLDQGDGLNAIHSFEEPAWARTDAEGRFSLRDLPEGRLYLQAAREELGFSELLAWETGESAELEFRVASNRQRFSIAANTGRIGVSLEFSPLGPRIARLVDGLPAQRGGLQVGDLITAINGRPTRFMSAVEFIARCRGPVGASVQLDVLRGGRASRLELVRETFNR